ncbi:MAG TPA: choice-of-anchor tandem repeat GloVer-containing protein [Verrucomicrobiae bacterium]
MVMTAFTAAGRVTFDTVASFTYTNGPNWGAASLAPRMGAMVQAGDGNLYGTMEGGGINPLFGWVGYGVIFQITPAGGFNIAHFFGSVTNSSGTPQDGYWPLGNLAKGADGNVYGTAEYGGGIDNGYGTVFRLATNGTFSVLHAFANDGYLDPNLNQYLYPFGTLPYAGVIQGSDGNFYGTTFTSSTNNQGAVFVMAPNGLMNVLHSFSRPTSGINYDGYNPSAELVEGDDGNFYGTTEYGGIYGYGTVYQITPTGSFNVLYSFNIGTNGANPLAGLCKGRDGSFYGTTKSSVPSYYNNGTVFRITTNGNFTTLHAFSGNVDDGAYPYGGVIQGKDGNLYGTTQAGGANSYYGTIFQMTTNGAVTLLHSFSTPANGTNADGCYPMATLVQADDGRFYGTTQAGGTSSYGTVFRLTITPDAPVLQGLAMTNGNITLTWSASVGAVYQVQYNTDLNSTNWINLGATNAATQTTMSASDAIGTDAQHFYRVVLLP